MECVLRAWSPAFDVDRFLSGSSWSPSRVDRPTAGHAAAKPGETFGFNLPVSASVDPALPFAEQLVRQVGDVRAFLVGNATELTRLVEALAPVRPCLDFGLVRQEGALAGGRSHFDHELLRAVADAGLTLAVSWSDAPEVAPAPHPPELMERLSLHLLPAYELSCFDETPTGCIAAILDLRDLLEEWADARGLDPPSGVVAGTHFGEVFARQIALVHDGAPGDFSAEGEGFSDDPEAAAERDSIEERHDVYFETWSEWGTFASPS